MERRPFGPTQREVQVIGQGTWYNDNEDPAATIDALRRGVDLGMTHIDTAEMYLSGAAEDLVAEAIAGRRDEVFLVSKVLPQNASRSGTIAACERSLTRLETDRLDCYLLHWRGDYPLKETFEAFEQLRSEGKILSWGVSNFDVPDLEEALRIAGAGRIACNQVLYHLQERAIEHAVLPWCEEHGVAVVAYSPFGHGDFPGRAPGGPDPQGDCRRPPRDPAPGRAAIPGAPVCALRDPEGFARGARGRKCGSRRPEAHHGRACPDR